MNDGVIPRQKIRSRAEVVASQVADIREAAQAAGLPAQNHEAFLMFALLVKLDELTDTLIELKRYSRDIGLELKRSNYV